MLLATVFASCTDENFLAEELTGVQLTEQRAVKIAVTETGWDGQTVSVTRAGETLEALKNNSERTWDFTKTPGVDLNVLKADAAGASPKWSYSAEGKLYTNLSNIDGTVVANGVELYMMEGLSISGTDNVGKIKIDVNNQLQLDDSNIVLTISNLKKGQKVTIKFAATGATAATFDTRTNLTGATGFDAANENTTQVGEATVAADGAVSFKNTTSGSGINIYSISVTRAESDGFGLYSSSDRLQVINSHIVWDSDIQSWKGISNDAYLMLWPNNTIDKDGIAFTAYAPYIDDESLTPTPTEGIISRDANSVVFKPISDNRIDLMYAEHTTSDAGVVQLNFKHALGKLSVGTISNNYGENINLTRITITGTRRTQGTLSLRTGEWSNITEDATAVEYEKGLLATIFGSLAIPDKGSLTFPKDVAYTQIPGTTLKFEYTFETDNHTTFSVSQPMTVEKGKNIFININIGQNHEVVLQ